MLEDPYLCLFLLSICHPRKINTNFKTRNFIFQGDNIFSLKKQRVTPLGRKDKVRIWDKFSVSLFKK